ncbi:hypothetical protein PTKIN_Ptkin08bG0154300 [Pterospermum kingtungense]
MGISTRFIALLVLAISLSYVNFAVAGKRYHVHISNGLNNYQKLTIHCKSGDDDLGWHVIPVSLEWNWTFRANFFGSTLYWCNMSWSKHQGSFEVFVMNYSMLQKCDFKECFWSARDDGLYLENDSDGSWLKLYNWTSVN